MAVKKGQSADETAGLGGRVTRALRKAVRRPSAGAATTETTKKATSATGVKARRTAKKVADKAGAASASGTAAAKAAAKKTPGAQSAAKTASAAKSAAKTATKKTPAAKKAAPAKAAPAAKSAAKKTSTPAKKTSTPAKTSPAKTAAPTKATAGTKPAAKKPVATKSAPKTTRATTNGAAKTGTSKKTVEKKTAQTRKPPVQLKVRGDEAPWTTKELAEVRTQLEAEVERLRGELSDIEHEIIGLMQDNGDGAGDDQADAGTKTFERDHEYSVAQNSRVLLVQAEKALAAIEDGTYGQCENCGNPIGKLRLQAFPRATLCLTCKQQQERH